MLDELRSTTHRRRMGRLVELGRRAAAGEAAAAAVIDGLWGAGPWGRWLAVQAAYGDRDEGRLVAALSDSHESVRRAGLRALLRLATDDGLRRAFDAVRGRTATRVLLVGAARGGRASVADGWLLARVGSPDRAVAARHADLLPLGSAAAVHAGMATFRELAGTVGWRRLGAWHPELAADALAKLGQSDAWARVRFQAALSVLVSRFPDAAVRAVGAAIAGGMLPGHLAPHLSLLARRRPVEVFDLLRPLATDELRRRPPGPFAGIQFRVHAERLGAERLSWLMEHAWHALPDGCEDGRRWLRALPSRERQEVVDAWLARGRGAWGAFLLHEVPAEDPRRRAAYIRWLVQARDGKGLCTPHALQDLPDDLRQEEARRAFDAEAIALEPARRCAYAALLSVAEAAERTTPWLKHPEGELRAMAMRAWLQSPRLDPGGLPDALRVVVARRYEQDPVRLAMLSTLADLPLRVWAPGGRLPAETLELLESALQHAYEAADQSAATALYAERLVCLLFRLAPEWGVQGLSRALRLRGSLSSLGLLAGMTEDEVRLLVPVLDELAERWCTRERWFAFTWLVAAIGRHLPLFPGVTRLLGEVAREVPFAGYAAAALDLLQRHHPDAFAPVADELFAKDRSAVVFASITRWIGRHRQDLLDDVLTGEPVTGRWATGKSTWVVWFDGVFPWWSDRQREALATALDALLADEGLDLPTAFRAVNVLVSLPLIDPARALRVAREGTPPAVREVAVRGLAHVDGPEAVAELLDALGDDRARYAIYALRRRFASMDDREVLAALLTAPRSKVTVAKEIARLLGELAIPEAHEALLSLAREPLHRDVRIAVLRGLWSSIERDATFDVFRAAADDPDPIVASRLAEVPAGQLSTEADRRMCELLGRVLGRPEEEARRALLQSVASSPLRDPDRTLMTAIVARCSAPGGPERKAATTAALLRLQPREAKQVAAAVLGPPGDHRGFTERSEVLVGMLGPWAKKALRAVAEAVFDALRDDPLRAVQALRLALPMTDTEGLAGLVEVLLTRGLLHTDAMIAALEVVRGVARPAALEERWRSHADPRMRRLALGALVAAAAPREGWTAARVERLAAYQRDADPGVAGAALVTFPPDPAGA
ncbi:MAG: hypothetical protein H6735_30785 [Alphaproteobacteria bacterium]|nr:hypothetical protein [Alphaproteobacteria bacterium]